MNVVDYIPKYIDVIDIEKSKSDPVIKAIIFEMIDNFWLLKKWNTLTTDINPIHNWKYKDIKKIIGIFKSKWWDIKFERLWWWRCNGDIYTISSLKNEKTTVLENNFWLIPVKSEIEKMTDRNMLDLKIILLFNFMIYNHYLVWIYWKLEDGIYAKTKLFKDISEDQLNEFIRKYKKSFNNKWWNIELIDWEKLYLQNRDFRFSIDDLKSKINSNLTSNINTKRKKRLEQKIETDYILIKKKI